MASRTRSQSSGWTTASKRSMVMTSSGENPKIARVLPVTQKTRVRVVQDPEPRLGGVRREAQALLALAQGFVGASSRERVGEDLRDQLQPLHHRVRPVALRPQWC